MDSDFAKILRVDSIVKFFPITMKMIDCNPSSSYVPEVKIAFELFPGHSTMSTAWETLLRRIDIAKEELGFRETEECFYRGHAESSWDLLPTLHRHAKARRIRTVKGIQKLEADLFFEFRSRARELNHSSTDDLEILFNMRHHGVATRLLDWTEVFAVALYFAMRDCMVHSEPCIWLLNPYALNAKSRARDLVAPEYLLAEDWSLGDYLQDFTTPGMAWKLPVALMPIQRNARLYAQRGYFTIHGDNPKPVDKQAESCVRCVKIPQDAWPSARDFLDRSGMNEYTLFPDMDGLARFLHAKYKI